MGMAHQFLPPQIKPLRDDLTGVGRAMPVLEANCTGGEIVSQGRVKPFGVMLEALDDLKPGEIYICSGGSPAYTWWNANRLGEENIRLGADTQVAREARLDGSNGPIELGRAA